MCEENNNTCCLYNLLNTINNLQNNSDVCNEIGGCDKPFLGPNINTICYNTRPVEFYNCQTGQLWEINYTNSEGTTATSSVFRVENVDNCCCTCRILIEDTTTPGEVTYTSTNNFFTIDLNCISAVQCRSDIILDL